uniref:Uncharacterized protein n=1 Tax=viral metagenome TaxID=1070528 RepID=A0A6C0EHI2_9ZZZZ
MINYNHPWNSLRVPCYCLKIYMAINTTKNMLK